MFFKKRMYPKFMNEFVNHLQFMLIKSLKRKGRCIKRGKFTVSSQIEQYLIRKFKVTKRFELSNILDELSLDQSICKNPSDPDQSSETEFKIRLGRKSVVKYFTTNGCLKNRCSNSIIYWEFIRIMRIAEEHDEIAVLNWKRKHEAFFLRSATKVVEHI